MSGRGRAAGGAGRRGRAGDRAARVGRARAAAGARRACRSWPPRPRSREDIPLVGVDQVAGARARRAHLLVARPPRRSGTSPGPPDWLEAQDRVRGWRSTLAAAGLRSSRRCWWATGARARATRCRPVGRRVRRLRGQRPDGARRAAAPARARPPHPARTSRWSASTTSRRPAYFTPPLTTVRQNFSELGRRALLLLLRQIEGDPRLGVRERCRRS